MAQAGGGGAAAVRPRLREGSVGLWGDIVAAVTNVAPSAAVALTLGSIIAASGLATPFLVIVVGLAMLCIAFAYHHLNLWQPTPGAQVMWIARAVTPLLGFAAGILLILESSVSNIANISLMGPYLLGIFSSDAASNPVLEYITSLVIMAIVCAIAVIGIRAAIKFQTYILWIEYGIMLIFALVVYWADFTGSSGATAPSLSWFTPSASPTGLSGIVAGIVITVFMFGGWATWPTRRSASGSSAGTSPWARGSTRFGSPRISVSVVLLSGRRCGVSSRKDWWWSDPIWAPW